MPGPHFRVSKLFFKVPPGDPTEKQQLTTTLLSFQFPILSTSMHLRCITHSSRRRNSLWMVLQEEKAGAIRKGCVCTILMQSLLSGDTYLPSQCPWPWSTLQKLSPILTGTLDAGKILNIFNNQWDTSIDQSEWCQPKTTKYHMVDY